VQNNGKFSREFLLVQTIVDASDRSPVPYVVFKATAVRA
jgi:hypothetical protein